jgi:hypothetical protein
MPPCPRVYYTKRHILTFGGDALNKPTHNGPLTLGPPHFEQVILYKVPENPPIPGQGLGPMFKS